MHIKIHSDGDWVHSEWHDSQIEIFVKQHDRFGPGDAH
jgi:hypothetical protein